MFIMDARLFNNIIFFSFIFFDALHKNNNYKLQSDHVVAVTDARINVQKITSRKNYIG